MPASELTRVTFTRPLPPATDGREIAGGASGGGMTPAALTNTTPDMPLPPEAPWIEQWYANRPAARNRRCSRHGSVDADAGPVNEPSSNTTWWKPPVLANVTVSPGLTATDRGVNRFPEVALTVTSAAHSRCGRHDGRGERQDGRGDEPWCPHRPGTLSAPAPAPQPQTGTAWHRFPV